MVKVTYYKIFETGVSGTGDVLAEQVMDHFRRDGILDAVRRRLKGVSSDGANVMIGIKVISYIFVPNVHYLQT